MKLLREVLVGSDFVDEIYVGFEVSDEAQLAVIAIDTNDPMNQFYVNYTVLEPISGKIKITVPRDEIRKFKGDMFTVTFSLFDYSGSHVIPVVMQVRIRRLF